MNITEYTLTISDGEKEKSLTYRGNENLVIKSNSATNDGKMIVITFPRHILEKFMEMINED